MPYRDKNRVVLCAWCSEEFHPWNTKPHQRFCSRSCIYAHQRSLQEKHPQWKDDAAYSTVHEWIGKRMPLSGVCEWCHAEGYTERANLDHQYRRVLSDWRELCVLCHREHDDIPTQLGKRPC